MSSLFFPGTDLGCCESYECPYVELRVWGWGGGAGGGQQMGWGQVASWGYLEHQDCAALKGLQFWVTLAATLIGPFSLAHETGR